MRCLLEMTADARRKLYDDPVHTAESLHLYLQVFEEEFLKRTAVFYAGEADKMMRGKCVSSFMRDVVSRLDEEIARGERLLHPDSMSRLRAAVEEKLVGAHMQYLQSEADTMVRNGREEDLAMVFKLLERLDGGLAPIRDCLKKYIIEQGTEIMASCVVGEPSKEGHQGESRKEAAKKRLAVVDDLVQLHRDETDLIQRCFGGTQIFIKALDDAFTIFMNRPLVGSFAMAEVLAYYMDSMLRNPRGCLLTVGGSTGGRGLRTTMPGASSYLVSHGLANSSVANTSLVSLPEASSLEEPLLQQMDRIIRLFMYVDDKDLFHETYRRSLAKRLLSKHDDVFEREFISKLKMQTGTVYTTKLSGMFQDVSISNDERQKFRSYTEICETDALVSWRLAAEASEARHVDFSAHVLNALFWPTFQEDHLRIPRPLVQWQRTFGVFYMRNKESRRITWIHSQSTNVVSANLNGKAYWFHVSTFQACVLLLFNDKTRISLSELSNSLNIQPSVLARHIQPLVVSKKSQLFICHGNTSNLPDKLPGYAGGDKLVESTEIDTLPLFAVPSEGGDNSKKRPTGDEASSSRSGYVNDFEIGEDSGAVGNIADSPFPNHVAAINAGFGGGGHPQVTSVAPLLSAAGGAAVVTNTHNTPSATGGAGSVAALPGVSNFLNSLNPSAASHGPASHGPAPNGAHPSNGAAHVTASGLSLLGATLVTGSALLAGASSAAAQNVGDGVRGTTLIGLDNEPESAVRNSDAPNSLAADFGVGADNDPLGVADKAHGAAAAAAAAADDDDDDDNCEADAVAMVTTGNVVTADGNALRLDSGSGEANNDAGENGQTAGAISEEDAEGFNCAAVDDVELTGADGDSGDSAESLPPPPVSGGQDAAHDIVYELVPRFRSRTIRVQYPGQIARVTTKEAVVARQNVVFDRNSILDAALVRIMKQRKTCGYQQLMAEVLSQVSGTFKPEGRAVKDRLEIMIEREFIERSPDDPSVMRFLS